MGSCCRVGVWEVVGPGEWSYPRCGGVLFGGKNKDIEKIWAPGRGNDIQQAVCRRGERGVQRQEVGGGTAQELGELLFSRPVFLGVLLDAGEEVGVVIGFDNGPRAENVAVMASL